MAIAFDSVGTASNTNSNGTISWPHTLINNSNGIILAFFGGASTPGTIVNPPTFAGSAMTKLINVTNANSTMAQEIWYLKNPPIGTGTFNGTWSNSTIGKRSISLAYTGINQSIPFAGSTTTSGTTGGSATLTDTTLGLNNWFVGAVIQNSGVGTTAIGNQRGTVTASSIEEMGADNTTGTLKWTWFGGQSAAVGAELNIASIPIQSSGTAALGLGSTSAVWGSNTTTGNLIVVGVTITNATTLGTVTSITDSQSNTYQKAISGTKSSALVSVIDEELWYAKNITGGAGSVTVNHSIDNAAVYVREYTGYSTLDATNSAIGSSSTPNTGTVNTNFSAELLVVSTGDDNVGGGQTWTAAGTYGDMVGTATTLTGVSMEDALQVGTVAQTGTLTLGNSSNWVSLFASFYQAAASGTVFPGYRSLLGVGQ